MDQISQIRERYKEKNFDGKDVPEEGQKVLYVPLKDSFLYMYYDGAYKCYDFWPADAFVIKKVEIGESVNRVFVCENKCVFSPAELIPKRFVSDEEVDVLKKNYKKILEDAEAKLRNIQY